MIFTFYFQYFLFLVCLLVLLQKYHYYYIITSISICLVLSLVSLLTFIAFVNNGNCNEQKRRNKTICFCFIGNFKLPKFVRKIEIIVGGWSGWEEVSGFYSLVNIISLLKKNNKINFEWYVGMCSFCVQALWHYESECVLVCVCLSVTFYFPSFAQSEMSKWRR